MDFSKWVEISETPEQVSRIASSKKAECTPVSVDREKQTGIFSGSHGVYNTSLEKCNCGDYVRRRLPCKHMYRLAAELGLWDADSIVSDSSKIKSPEPTPTQRKEALLQVVDKIESYSLETQDMIREIMYCFNTEKTYMCEKTELYSQPLNDGLISASYDYEKIIKSYTQKCTIEKLEEVGFVYPEEIKKTKKARYEYCLEHAEDICKLIYPFAVFLRPCGLLEVAKKKVYTYLLRKLTDSIYYNENGEECKVPHGAEFSGTMDVFTGKTTLSLSFPNDEVTELLNKYGVNRCIDWKFE